jgi:hypothetical protein
MIDRGHKLPLTRQTQLLLLGRGSLYDAPRPVPLGELAVMRRIDALHLNYPFAGARMLRDLLRAEDTAIGREKVTTLMRRMGIEAVYRRPNTSKLPLAFALRLKTIPVTRVENMCATGTEALRAATYAVAAGACDIALALGVEKLKDTGYGGLPLRTKGLANDLWMPYGSAPGGFAQLAGAYAARHGTAHDDLKRAMAHVSWKSHQNGVNSPKAHQRKAVSMETILNAPMIADPLGLFDCCGVSDGAACAIVTTPEIARSWASATLSRSRPFSFPRAMAGRASSAIGMAPMCATPGKPRNALMPKPEFLIRARISAWWRCKIASPLPNSSPWKIWDYPKAAARRSIFLTAISTAPAACLRRSMAA